MLKRVGVVVVWVLATLGTASLTYAAVSRAGSAVGDNPAVPVAASDIAARVPTTTAEPTTTSGAPTTSLGATTTAGTPASTSTTAAALSTTTTTTHGGTTTSQATTTTAQAVSRTEWKTVPGVGTVGVSVQGDRVALVSATPVAPFHVEGVESGGDRVEIQFKSESAEYRIRADVEDGVLRWEVDDPHEGESGG